MFTMIKRQMLITGILAAALLIPTATIAISKADAATKSVITYSQGTSETVIVRDTKAVGALQEASDVIEATGVKVGKDFATVLKNADKTKKFITLTYGDVTIDVIPTPKRDKILILIER
jgi:hypothetical protein